MTSTVVSLPPITTIAVNALFFGFAIALFRRLLRIRLRPRIRPAFGERIVQGGGEGKVSPATDDYGLSDHQRPSGLLETWYLNQPQGQKRCFIEALTFRGVQPTRLQLECALTRVMMNHPVLLMAPHPDGTGFASQVTETDVQEGGMLAFPLPHATRCITVESEDTELDGLMQQLINLPSEADITAAAFSSRSTHGITWSGLRLHFIPSSRQDEFTLVLRLAHVIGDGMSGLNVLKGVMSELSSIVSSAVKGEELPSIVPVAQLASIAGYPGMDGECERQRDRCACTQTCC
jgi:hypothetical protein